jgi:uncharacterized surface protein with fasciclin (FAS1) repeats
MKNLKTNIKSMVLVFTAIALITFAGCNDDDEVVPEPDQDLVEFIGTAPSLRILSGAIDVAGLTSTLKGPGPFTIFAPNNAAFEKLPKEVLQALLAHPALFADLLTYHVVSGSVKSTDLTSGSVMTLLDGESIEVFISGGAVTLNSTSKVIGPDYACTNGYVHIIDEVLFPEGFELPKNSIIGIAAGNPNLSTLVSALIMFPDLVSALGSDGTYTVFAPDNDAFAALLEAIEQTSLDDIPESVLRSILEYHVISTAVIMSGDLTDGQTAEALSGEQLTVTVNNDGIFISDSKVTSPDIEASNGVIHIMENVMIPPSIDPM